MTTQCKKPEMPFRLSLRAKTLIGFDFPKDAGRRYLKGISNLGKHGYCDVFFTPFNVAYVGSMNVCPPSQLILTQVRICSQFSNGLTKIFGQYFFLNATFSKGSQGNVTLPICYSRGDYL
jgi:hypothetical protein